MERLTKRDTDGKVMMDCEKCKADLMVRYGKPLVDCTALYCRNCLKNRLAAYEDTGLTPEEVNDIVVGAKLMAKAKVVSAFGVAAERLRELAEADRDERLVVLPCKVGDRLYEVTGRKTISVYKVRAIRVESFCLFIEWDIVEGFVWQSLSGINDGEIGKTVFLTSEEAEKALEGKKDD